MTPLRFLAGKNLTRASRNLWVPPEEESQGPVLCSADPDAAGSSNIDLRDIPTLEKEQGAPGKRTAIQLP